MTGWQKVILAALTGLVVVVFAALGYLIISIADTELAPHPTSPRWGEELALHPTLPPVAQPREELTPHPISSRAPQRGEELTPLPTSPRWGEEMAPLPASPDGGEEKHGSYAAEPTPVVPVSISTPLLPLPAHTPVFSNGVPISADSASSNLAPLPTLAPVTQSGESTRPESASPGDDLDPIRLRIPGIEVDAPIIPVGLEPSGVMAVPYEAHIVGWYELGPRPGEPSNAVLAGHLNWMGQVGVFSRLHELKAGDVIEVEARSGISYRYVVDRMQSYQNETAPVAEIFAPTGKPVLTLITCAGAYDITSQEYRDRLIVRAWGEVN